MKARTSGQGDCGYFVRVNVKVMDQIASGSLGDGDGRIGSAQGQGVSDVEDEPLCGGEVGRVERWN